MKLSVTFTVLALAVGVLGKPDRPPAYAYKLNVDHSDRFGSDYLKYIPETPQTSAMICYMYSFDRYPDKAMNWTIMTTLKTVLAASPSPNFSCAHKPARLSKRQQQAWLDVAKQALANSHSWLQANIEEAALSSQATQGSKSFKVPQGAKWVRCDSEAQDPC